MRDNAASYQQSIQLESKLKELEAECQIVQQQRDIANKEREKFVMESVSHKVSIIIQPYPIRNYITFFLLLTTEKAGADKESASEGREGVGDHETHERPGGHRNDGAASPEQGAPGETGWNGRGDGEDQGVGVSDKYEDRNTFDA